MEEQKELDSLDQLTGELMHIAMGDKTYPEYDKNGEERPQYPDLGHRLKAMEMLAKLLAGRPGQKKRTVLVDDL